MEAICCRGACDLRSNFGQTTQVGFVGREILHCNFGDIPIIEKYICSSGIYSGRYCTSIYRRILGFEAGKARLVTGESEIDPENGVFMKTPLHIMENFPLHPAAKSLFAAEYFLPRSRDCDTASCLAMLAPPPPSVLSTTSWIASRLSGVDVCPRPPALGESNPANQKREEGDTHSGIGEDLIKSIHEKWESRALIFNYIILQEVTIGSPIKQRVGNFARLIDMGASCATHLFEKTVGGE